MCHHKSTSLNQTEIDLIFEFATSEIAIFNFLLWDFFGLNLTIYGLEGVIMIEKHVWQT